MCSVSPTYCCPMVTRMGEPAEVDMVEDEVDLKHAMMKDPIVGMETITWEQGKGDGALAARPLSSPKEMSDAQRRVHDLTHLPYDPGCAICVSCRRPNDHHRMTNDSTRTIPLVVADYAFPKNFGDEEPLTVLVMRVYPYKVWMVCWVPSKGRDPRVVARIARFLKDIGLTHFAYRSDREPAISAMIEDACAQSGRKGTKLREDDDNVAIADDDLGMMTGVDVSGGIDSNAADTARLQVESTHTATPEVSHPGESQSNGKAEKSVGDFVGQLRTLKTALESRLKAKLSSSHPVMHWLIEHTAYILNKFSLGSDGKTPYGRLHGKEGRERICEFGERVMWYVPKKLRSKLDQRWRYGIFLGRSMSSDQNFVGIASGEVVCARAIVRVVPSVRWDMDRIAAISTTPFDYKSKNLDVIEEDADPHSHPEPKPSEDNEVSTRRLKIFDADVKKFGYTNGCPRCGYVKSGQLVRAKGTRHSELCRDRVYQAMREAGVDKIKRADEDHSERTQSKRSGKKTEEPDVAIEVPMEPVDEPIAEAIDIDEAIDDNTSNGNHMDFDTENFFNEVNDDLDVDHDGDEIIEDSDVMSPLMDVLQTLGVDAAEAANFSKDLIKDVPIMSTTFGEKYAPTFFEFYGQGNFVKESHGRRRNLNLNGLNAFDLRTTKPNGECWDFRKPSDRREARKFVEEQKPTWVIGCPPCTFFSLWNQALNHKKMDPKVVEERRREAVMHLRFVIGIYKIQLEGGRHFLHEHPQTATSWKDDMMVKLLREKRISTTVSDQCEYGLMTPGPNGEPMLAKKPTMWASSSPQMLQRLSRRCKGDHEHQHLVGGRAKAAENYPLDLVTEILRGMRDTADHEEQWGDETNSDITQAMLQCSMFHEPKFSSLVAAYRAQDLEEQTQRMSVKVKFQNGKNRQVDLQFKETYKDEYTCEQLPMGHVKIAMQEELAYFCDKVWEAVPLAEAQADTEGKIIGSRWVNCNKNDVNDPDVRCRLVAQEVNLQAESSFYAATPPLEAKRFLFSQWATEQKRQGERLQLSFVDVKKAYFYGVPDRRLYVRFPPELGMPKDMVGRLVRCMYGTRDAGAIWENCYTKCLLDLGFVQGTASPCCFCHEGWGVHVVVHGDDFTALGTPTGLDHYEKGMADTFECKFKGRLGHGEKDLKEMRVLNRIVRIDKTGLRYEADPRHAELLAKSLNLTQCRTMVTPGVKIPFDDSAPTDDTTDDAMEEAVVGATVARERLTKFSDHVEVYDVPCQLTIYGRHPKTFDFNADGSMVPRAHSHQEEAFIHGDECVRDVTMPKSSSPNSRMTILRNVLRDGAAWETPTTELIAKISKSQKNKFQKARLGTKAAKNYEKLECVGDLLDEETSTMFRALAARYLYLAMDRPECAFSAKELCRQFASPTKKGVEALKRAVRFLVGMPRLVYHYEHQPAAQTLKVYVDTDFAGCHTSRRSTSGGVAMRGGHCVKHWSSTQTTVTLSSGEAELGGICKGASHALGLQSLANDLGIPLQLEVLADATAAIGICRRRGLGKIRHLHVADLWIQDRVRRGDFLLTKCLGQDNPADMLTKHVSKETMLKHMQFLGLIAEDGRAASAPTIDHK